jgi:hypothetical protein
VVNYLLLMNERFLALTIDLAKKLSAFSFDANGK